MFNTQLAEIKYNLYIQQRGLIANNAAMIVYFNDATLIFWRLFQEKNTDSAIYKFILVIVGKPSDEFFNTVKFSMY